MNRTTAYTPIVTMPCGMMMRMMCMRNRYGRV